MRAGPIWNNRIPFAIVFLSVSLFFLARRRIQTTNAYRLSARACALASPPRVDERKEREREERREKWNKDGGIHTTSTFLV